MVDQFLFGLDRGRPVVPRPAISLERAICIEHWAPANRPVSDAGRSGYRVMEVAEGAPRLKIRKMLLPVGFVVLITDIAPRLPDCGLCRKARHFREAIGKICEAEILVAFPDPVGGYFYDILEPLLALLKRLACFPLFGNIDQNPAQTSRLPLFRYNRNNIADPAFLPICGDQPIAEIVIHARSRGLGTNPKGFVAVIGMDNALPETFGQPVVGQITEHGSNLRSDVREAHGFRVKLPRDNVRGLDQGFVSLLALAECGLGTFSFGDVIGHNQHMRLAVHLDSLAE